MNDETRADMETCTCTHYVVDYSDPDRYHPENVDREDDPGCPVHGAGNLAREMHHRTFPTHADCEPNSVELREAAAILASDWLADRLAAARAEGAAAALEPVGKLADAWEAEFLYYRREDPAHVRIREAITQGRNAAEAGA